MRVRERHVLTIDKGPVIQSILDTLMAGANPDGGVPPEACKGLEEYSKQGCNRLILNLRVINAQFGERAAAIRNLSACLLGEVLVISAQVTPPWMHQIRKDRQRYSFPRHLISSFGVLFELFQV